MKKIIIIVSFLIILPFFSNVATAQNAAISIIPLPVTKTALQIKPLNVCDYLDGLLKDYDELTLSLQKAEQAGDKEAAEVITKKIIATKQGISEFQKRCKSQLVSISPPYAISKSVPPKAVDVVYCSLISQLENKISYYSKLNTLGEEDLKKDYGFTKAEIERIVLLLKADLAKSRAQCENQKYLQINPTVTSKQPYPKIEISLSAGQVVEKLKVAEKLKIEPKLLKLKEKNSMAVYEIKVSERRQLFGFIPLNISKVITASAENGNVTKEVLPWYSFLTTK